ncbi:MAG TPA: DUF3782 domain-containing protein [Thermodesulfovibrionia bacterium]|nr:DUF3782 domain-containing protein [Thermodesulfovibrionia bacterium]
MIAEETRQIILKELPKIIKTDEEVRRLILDLASNQFADKRETESRFDRILNELQRDREEQSKRWEQQNRKWDEHTKKWEAKWDEQNRKWDEQNKKWEAKWDEQNRKWDEHNKKWEAKWEEQNKRWEAIWEEQNKKSDEKWKEQNEKWEVNQKAHDNLMEEVKQTNRRLESRVGGLGARWGLYSEQSFRNGLKAILEETFKVNVIHVNEWDDKGFVFGRPDQIELDIIIKNSHLIICELKSSISRTEMHIFERKVRFYEEKHGRKCDRMVVISSMVDLKAKHLAEELGIETYTHSYDVKETQEDTDM